MILIIHSASAGWVTCRVLRKAPPAFHRRPSPAPASPRLTPKHKPLWHPLFATFAYLLRLLRSLPHSSAPSAFARPRVRSRNQPSPLMCRSILMMACSHSCSRPAGSMPNTSSKAPLNVSVARTP